MSLLPSATEIVGGLGLESHLVGVSHECDVAPTAERLRAVLEAGCVRVTTSDIDPHTLPQGEIDRRVKAALKEGVPLQEVYRAAEQALNQERSPGRAHP